MKSLLIAFLLFFFTNSFSQKSTQALTADMFSKDNSIQLSKLDGWIFKPGNDTAWADTNLKTGDWKKLKPADFTEKMRDEKGKLEGWFRLKIKLDNSLQDSLLGIGLTSDVWAASDVYINGKLFHSFGNTGLNSKPFKEYNAKNKLPILFPVNTNREYLIAIHFSDKINQYDFYKKLRSNYSYLISITSPHYANQYYQNTLQDANINLGVSIFLLVLALLFWSIYFQNKEEKHLLAIALTVSFLLLSWFKASMFFDHSFILGKFFDFIETSSFILYFSIVPFTVGIILNKRISKLHWIFASIVLIVASICNYVDFYTSSLILILIGISGMIATYYIISARKAIKGARWAVVIGIIINLIYTLFYFLLQLAQTYISETFNIISLVFVLTIFPIGLLVYVSMWFKETRKAVEENAEKILQITEEKKELLESQNIILEKQVSERTRELNLSLENLKATQSQLIQSEKMASLGELTSGIAHEIQNPLNFVNNFSEVNKELLVEMKDEIKKGNLEGVSAIADDVISNEEKINHHGKRADAIVKGMLQHSRSTNNATKEPTDINALADEYLRLAYHGLGAKDKTFNATMKTDFDESIGNINIIPQDIGRVVLNLMTNAFYVVNEKSKQNIAGYEPIVEVSTKKEGNKVLVSVKDNGNGIPLKVLDKIFQPFFTTKPTGQGTGLGLSLSYDIVKAHGGDIKVNTKENEGTEFTIFLPV